jgi:nuclear pore complex protein Nup155
MRRVCLLLYLQVAVLCLANLITEGFSSDYDIPTSHAWWPFQKLKEYQIPDRIFEQYNQGQFHSKMGLFAELNHAWITIDNALYMWDYTSPNPDLIGMEDQPYTISAVKLVVPRPGVFKSNITHLLVVATTHDIFIMGVSTERTADSVYNVSLYQTNISMPTKGQDVNIIESSRKTGRIFFAGYGSDDVYELMYQQSESWFSQRCSKINHVTQGRFVNVLPSLTFSSKPPKEQVKQIVIDDSRSLLYTLSSLSSIRVFQMKPNNGLDCLITRSFRSFKEQMGHLRLPRDSVDPEVSLVSLHPITASEGSQLSLMGTTNTGYRIFFSTMSASYGYRTSDPPPVPSSIQVQFVKVPPQKQSTSTGSQPSSSYAVQPTGQPSTSSKELHYLRLATRLPPGYFFGFKEREQGVDVMFASAPDTGRIALGGDQGQMYRTYHETGTFFDIGAQTEDVDIITPVFGAGSKPQGFGNELAVQFDQPATELAVLTNSGVKTYRRRRLVDVFAAIIRYSPSSDKGLDGELKRFAQLYGRDEISATALAVACGHGSELANEFASKISDAEIVDTARRAFIEYGGKATVNENLLDQAQPGIENVRPSPRHNGIALYISRLVRSVWKAPILRETATALGLNVIPTVPLKKTQDIQKNLIDLKTFLNDNKSLIDGLAGPEALGRVASKQEEIALQGEHRALNALMVLLSNIIEGISFVHVLFDERVDEILLSLPEATRSQVRSLTFEGLFTMSNGKELAKELVKAIVNRNISKGSNVETVADALRRRCGSFCSSDDVVIFKAQEQVNKASQSPTTETSRALLNDSLELFIKVASSLTMEHLTQTVYQYVHAQFYAGKY